MAAVTFSRTAEGSGAAAGSSAATSGAWLSPEQPSTRSAGSNRAIEKRFDIGISPRSCCYRERNWRGSYPVWIGGGRTPDEVSLHALTFSFANADREGGPGGRPTVTEPCVRGRQLPTPPARS